MRKRNDTINKAETKAKADANLDKTKECNEATRLELRQLSNRNAKLHQSCDVVLRNSAFA